MRPWQCALVLLVLQATSAGGAVVFPTGPTGYVYAFVTTNGLPNFASYAGPVTRVMHVNPDGSENLAISAADRQSIRFGPSGSHIFIGAAGTVGFARVKIGLVRLYVAAGASVDKLTEPLGDNPFQTAAGVGLSGNFEDVVVPPPTAGKPFGSPTTLTIGAVFTCTSSVASVNGIALGTYLGVRTSVGAALWQMDGTPIDGVGNPFVVGCGASVGRTVGGLTVGTPVVLTYSASLYAGAIAGDNLPSGQIGSALHTEAEGVGLNTGYVVVTDADGNGVVGESGFDYGAEPAVESISIPTTTTTTTTTLVPTTLPGCAMDAYCGDGIHQPGCGEACECPMTAQGKSDLSCSAAAALPPLGQACAVCVGCQENLDACPTTTTTTPGPTTTTTSSPVTTTTSSPATTTTASPTATTTTFQPGPVTTTTQPRPAEVCGDCLDNDGNGRVDREDPTCCAAPLAVVLRKSRLVPGGVASLDLILPGRGQMVPDLARGGLSLQMREAGGPSLLCLRIPPLTRKGKTFVFRDRTGKLPGAEGISGAKLRVARADAVLHLEGRKVALARPTQSTLELTLGFADAASGPCGAARQTLRRQGKSGLRFP